MTTEPKFELIPLATLSLAPENARHGMAYAKEELDTLQASILSVGRLLTPLNVYRDDKGAPWVWDGGRRLAALQGLADAKSGKRKLPADLAKGIPALVDPDNSRARLHSLATFVREEMNDAEEFLAYKALFDQGLEEAEIAASTGKTTPRVRQLLRLRSVAPDLISAFAAGKIPLDAMEAFSITEDHEAQRQVYASFKGKVPDGWQVRSALRKNTISTDAWLAKFVGREAYEAAGGRFLTDLFNSQGNALQDVPLLKKLAEAKLKAVTDELTAEGWGTVEHIEGYQHGFDAGYEQRKGPWDAEAKKGGTVFLVEGSGGKLDIKKGYFKASKSKTPTTDGGKKAAADPAMFGYTHSGHAKLTTVATMATRVALVRKPAAAYDALLTHLAWGAFRLRREGGYGAAQIHDSSASLLNMDGHHGSGVGMEVEGEGELKALRTKWDARLPKARIAFCDYVAGLGAKEKAELLALSFADSVDGIEQRFDYMRRPTRWAHLGWMANHAGADLVKAWTPDADFLKSGSRDALQLALQNMGLTAKPDAKKGELVAQVAANAKEKGWTPKLLATLTDAKDLEPKAPGTPPALDDEYDDGEGLETEGELEDEAAQA